MPITAEASIAVSVPSAAAPTSRVNCAGARYPASRFSSRRESTTLTGLLVILARPAASRPSAPA